MTVVQRAARGATREAARRTAEENMMKYWSAINKIDNNQRRFQKHRDKISMQIESVRQIMVYRQSRAETDPAFIGRHSSWSLHFGTNGAHSL